MIRFSLRHPISVMMALLAVVLLGVLGAMAIPVDLLPKLSVRRILISAEYEGLPASEMRKMVTLPLEDAFVALKGLKQVSSISRDALSLVTIDLHWGVDADMALVEAREIIDLVYETLPTGCKKPTVMKQDAAGGDTVTLALLVRGEGNLANARYIADKDIKPRFQRLNGAGSVTVSGGEKERIQVLVRREAMEGRGLSLQGIAGTLGQLNFEYPAGNIREGDKQLLVKTAGLFRSLEDITEAPLKFTDSGLVTVGDVAKVSRGSADRDTFFSYDSTAHTVRHDSVSCIRIGISKKQGASPLILSREIRREIERLSSLYGQSIEFRVIADQAAEVKASLASLGISALVGVAVCFLVILFFFRSLRLSFIIASVIPLATLVEIFVLYAAGRSLNTMSLSGIALGIGMVVDSGAVVLENLEKHQNALGRPLDRGEAEKAVKEVKGSNIGSGATTVIVFLPVFLMGGWARELFGDLALGIVTAVSSACVLSFTAIPALFILIPTAHSVRRVPTLSAFTVNPYEAALQRIFRHPRRVVGLLLLCVAIGAGSLLLVKREILPETEVTSIAGELVFAPGTGLEYLEELAGEVVERVAAFPWALTVAASGGLENDDYQALGKPEAKKEKIVLDIALRPGTRSKKAARDLSEIFQGARGFTFHPLANKSSLSSLFQTLFASLVLVTADSPEVLRGIIAADLDSDNTPLTERAAFVPEETAREYVFTPDRTAHARFRVTTVLGAAIARQALSGVESAPFYDAGREIPLWVSFPKGTMTDTDDIESLAVTLPAPESERGDPAPPSVVPLRALGRITDGAAEKVLYRYGRQDAKIITNPAALSATITDANITDTGAEEMRGMLLTAALLMGGVLALLYLVMGAQFESFSLPLVFLLSLVPAFSGAFVCLLITGKSLNMNSVIALVILFGIAVNNGIILYESCVEGLKSRHHVANRVSSRIEDDAENVANRVSSRIEDDTRALVIRCCGQKLRAILVTTGTTICAMLPFAIDPWNKSAQSSLAVVLTGGLLVSTLVVMLVIPVVLARHFKKQESTRGEA